LSCLAGVLLVFLVFLFADFAGREPREKVLIFAILISMGSMQLFFGYVEHYSFLYLLTFAFILSALAYLEGKLGWLLPLVAFVLTCLSHVSALCLLPSLLYILAARPKDGKSSGTRKAFFVGAGLVFLALGLAAYKYYSWTVPPVLVPLLADRYEAPGYLLFSVPHIVDFLNQQLLTSPAGLIMVAAPLVCGLGASFLKNKIFRFLVLVGVSQLSVNFLLNPGLGASRDWDLFSPLVLGYTILGLLVLLHLLKDKPGYGYLSLILVLTSLYSTAPWVILNSCERKSVARFQNLLEIDPKRSANGHYILISHFEARGMQLQAERQDDKYSETFPEMVLFVEGTSLVKKGELEKAEGLLLQAERLAPNLAHIHHNLGHLYFKRGELDNAELKFKKAISLSSHYTPPYENLADLYIMRQQYDQALDACKRAIRLKTTSPEVYSNAATIYLVKGRLSEAEAFYRKTLTLDPEFADAYVGLGDIYNRKAMSQEALRTYLTAAQLRPDLAKVHFRLGMTYLSLNSRERAKEELELYLRISPHGKNAREAQEALDRLK
jgi:tetratricopeptide (TPR) repeat protein